MNSYLEQVDIALVDGWYDFTGRVIRKEPSKLKSIPGEYIMQPFEIRLAYKGKSWLTVPLEIGHDEIGDTDTYDYCISQEIVNIFEKLRFPAPNPIALF